MDDRRVIKFFKIDKNTAAQHEMVQAIANTRIRLLGYAIIADALVDVTWRSAATDKSGPLGAGANGGVSYPGTQDSPALETAAGEALNLNLAGAVQVSGHGTYVEIT